MNPSDIIHLVLQQKINNTPALSNDTAFAPTNIALVKYWGKRNQTLNLPMTSSLSISLNDKGATTHIQLSEESHDVIILNQKPVALTSDFATRLCRFLDLFRGENNYHFKLTIETNIPIAAGLASSACGFASVVKALNGFFGWELASHGLSILARLGSGSASRSLWHGFVEWHAGEQDNGMDSYAEIIGETWPELCVGLLIFNQDKKSISSRVAMHRTVATSALYSAWPSKVASDLSAIKTAIRDKDFDSLGQIAESNAMTMHATMLSAWPPVSYYLPETISTMQTIWKLREEGLPLYFTQDAGPNLKLLFLKENADKVVSHFSNVEIVRPFDFSRAS